MAVKTEITACLKHNKIDNKSVGCESLPCAGLLPKHAVTAGLMLSRKPPGTQGCDIFTSQREGQAS